jgi:threonine/homoserine/homoserine lactone efflux protein
MIVAGGALVAFVILEFTLCLIPGPAVLLTVTTALRRGAARGMAAAAGIVAGNTLYFGLSALGVVALLLASYQAFTVVKWAGALYLAFLGVRSLLVRKAPPDIGTASAVSDKRVAFSSGFVTQVANPKAIVFFAAILPQFVDPRGNVPLQLLILAVASQVIELSVLSGYVVAAARVRRSSLAGRAALWIERLGGAILIAIAVRVAREPLVATP